MESLLSSSQSPWQFQWKHPTWQKLNELHPEPGVPVAHVAAALHSWEEEEHLDGLLLPSSSAPSRRTLTVTLLQTTTTTSGSSSNSRVADVLILKVIQCSSSNNNPSSSSAEFTVLYSRVLRWPTTEDITSSTTAVTTAAAIHEDGMALEGIPDLHTPHREMDVMMNCYQPMDTCLQTSQPLLALLSMLKPASHQQQRQRRQLLSDASKTTSRRRQPQRNIQYGLIAVALLRRPRVGVSTSSSKNPTGGDAQQQQQQQAESATDLVLACLTNRGKVHFYNPWTLLGGADSSLHQPTTKKRPLPSPPSSGVELEESMASFLFGRSLLKTVQETILPLSQPERTLKLSLPFLQRLQPPATRIIEDLDEDDDDDDDENDKDASKKTNKMQPSFLSFFDASLWNPVLDSATLPFQTVENVPTLCVAALDYLVVAGKGRKRWRTESQQQQQQLQGEAPILREVESVEESETLNDETSVRSGRDSLDSRPAARGSRRSRRSDGGFVTFISLQSYTETRTVFVPFVPSQISPFVWGSMHFLLVVGQGHAVAIHMAAPMQLIVAVRQGEAPSGNELETPAVEAPSLSDPRQLVESAREIMVHPFEVLPLDLSGSDRASHVLLGSEISTSPPGIAILFQDSHTGDVFVSQRLLNAIDLVPKENLSVLFHEYGPQSGNDEMPVITTVQQTRHTARVVAPRGTALWGHLSQGWCIVGFADKACFVCFDGSNSESRAYVYDLATPSTTEQTHELSQSIVSSVLPVHSPSRTLLATRSAQRLGLLFSGPLSSPISMDGISDPPLSAGLDDIVVEAMDSISHLSYRESIANLPVSSPSRRAFTFSHHEKSKRLVQKCASWTKLEQSPHAPAPFEAQTLVVSVQTVAGNHFVLSLRASALDYGPCSPFQEVLAWLSQKEDFFTAASLALDLLRDSESLRHLWRAFDKIDDDTERSKLEGLLDGIVPIYNKETDVIDENSPLWATLRQLADMTVGCLTKGGYPMASTLEQFLAHNKNYDPSRACLILVAMTANAVSEEKDLVASAMGKDYLAGKDHVQKILWPVRCLLQVGVSRDHLKTALVLLNTTIPDELRRRDRGGMVSTSIPSMDMCKSLVSLIVASSLDAAEILLDLVDEKTRSRFWDSLEHETRLELSQICISEKFPFFLDPEVRAWVLNELDMCIASECSGSGSDISTHLPTPWLCELASACLQNAGCSVDLLLNPNGGEEKKNGFGDDNLSQYGEQVVKTRRALTASAGSGGLDHGLLIPALLVLEHRGTLWYSGSKTSTRSLLNAVCYMAGRRSVEESLFTLNGSTLMRQCTLVGDIEAGAHLIGGPNGLVLECCHIMMNAVHIDMDTAENFLLSGKFSCEATWQSADLTGSFEIGEKHSRILWLLEEHVLKVRTYGEFEKAQLRGRIDPVFAATICFRTWWVVTRQQNLPMATKWLTEWLRQKLSISEKSARSPYRLVCAALVRALIWPEQRNDGVEATSAYMLKLDSSFLVQLSHSCCGLVEALPDYISEQHLLAKGKETSATMKSKGHVQAKLKGAVKKPEF